MNPQTKPIKCVGTLCELRHALCAISGTYQACTVCAGFGIAIDIAAAHSHYWLRTKPGAVAISLIKMRFPGEIVRIFEAHGFIWGGTWHHYDTMHFEYRHELVGAAK
jgi:uncharacterized membrane protein YedE/YeeE